MLSATGACAANLTRILKVDLNPLIDGAAQTHEQFAVEVQHGASVLVDGSWSRQGSTSTWTYRVCIPTAVSLSFMASDVVLPASAELVVSAAGGSVRYTARDIHRTALIGRPLPGDTLTFKLTVPTAEVGLVRLQIGGLQAGYRSLASGIQDHPHFAALQKAAVASVSCIENFQCHVTQANAGSSHATVAVIVGNLYQCTGTLLNNARGDGVPYILTARHCQTGRLMGGNPDIAGQVGIYWDAVSPCGSTLGSIYEVTTPYQSGAATVLEQQDAWLLQLDAPPAATDAYFAGWDAGGGPVNGGYTIHHALGGNQQFAAWTGNDLFEAIPGTTFNITYDSTFVGVVNSTGSVGAGASGSALFSPGGLVLGSASLALVSGGVGVCPVSPASAPSPATVTALFTSLSGIWTSTADATSSTPTRTMKSLLDPDSSGQLNIIGLPTQPLTIAADKTSATTGDSLTLTWSASGATSCNAWGGESGDGWAGTQPASGSLTLGNQRGGTVTYALSCRAAAGLLQGSAAVSWNYNPPVVSLSGLGPSAFVLGTQAQINWTANTGPCTATGGIPGDGWAGTKQTTGSYPFTLTQLGLTTYTLTCGTGSRTANSTAAIYAVNPRIFVGTDVASIHTGANFSVFWRGNGVGTNVCATSGGSATDNWSLNTAPVNMDGSSLVHEDNPGTYTFTLTCTSAGQVTTASATVQVVADPPAISLTAVAPTQQVYSAAVPYIPTYNIVWTSNLSSCTINYTSNSGGAQALLSISPGNPLGAAALAETVPGLVTYTLTCGSLSATTTINWVAGTPPPILTTTDPTWAANVPYAVSWNASSGPCVGSGGSGSDGWAGNKASAGTQSVEEAKPGAYLFALTCGNGPSATTSYVAVNVRYPFVDLLATPVFVSGLVPQTQIVWNASLGPCTYTDGSMANPVAVGVPPSGSSIPSPAHSGVFVFTLTCGAGASVIEQSTVAAISVGVPTTLSASKTTTSVNSAVVLTWTSNGTGICYVTKGTGTIPWIGTLPDSGSLTVTSRSAGTFTYGVECGSIAEVTVTYTPVAASSPVAPAPAVSLAASRATATVNQSITLTWSAIHSDSCVAGGGTSGDGWLGAVAPSGSKTLSEANPGTVTYTITCSGAPPAATANATVVVSAASSGGGSGGGSSGGGGGGAMDLRWLLLLGAACALRAKRSGSPGRASVSEPSSVGSQGS
jgi:hypothetical protein